MIIGTVLAVGFCYGAALNVGMRAVDGFVRNKDKIGAAFKRGIAAAKHPDNEKENEKED